MGVFFLLLVGLILIELEVLSGGWRWFCVCLRGSLEKWDHM